MAAEKLTKARLAQILITLLVLISAFLWRTFSHESGTHITCGMEKPCQFDIEGKRVTVFNSGHETFPSTPFRHGMSNGQSK